MSQVVNRSSRHSLRFRPSWSWSALVALGLVPISGSWSLTTQAGESDAPAQTPAASHDGADAPKAKVASAPSDSQGKQRLLDATAPARSVPASLANLEADPIAKAKRAIAECQVRYHTVEDYTCTFFKRERIDGKLYTPHIITMKARTKPSSLYFKFIQPNAGREAIYIHGRYNNKIVAHDVGLGRVIAGTMHLDPKGGMAMEENHHPVTEAGLGTMIDHVKERWEHELQPGESVLHFHNQAKVGDRACLMIESIHPKPSPDFLFHKVKLYIDKEQGLPIRFEAYDWPKQPGAEPDLMEEYTYMNLKLNVGLKDRDFDPKNSQYSYGRF